MTKKQTAKKYGAHIAESVWAHFRLKGRYEGLKHWTKAAQEFTDKYQYLYEEDFDRFVLRDACQEEFVEITSLYKRAAMKAYRGVFVYVFEPKPTVNASA